VTPPATPVAPPTRRDLVAELAERLGSSHEARFVVDEALDRLSRPGHRAPGATLDDAVMAEARALAARRAMGEPLQYVFGHWPFRTLDLVVDPRVLIPRPETEQVVEVALGEARRLGPDLVVVDAGTGSGAIALSVATELGPVAVREVWATDISSDALAVARDNHDALSRHAAGPLPPVRLVHGSWLEPLPGRLAGAVGLVVSNPPYVSAAEWAGLDPEVRAEPHRALVAGPASEGTEGLADVEAVLLQALSWLGRPGTAVVELAPHQAHAAVAVARHLGYDEVRTEPDLAGRPRALVARTGG